MHVSRGVVCLLLLVASSCATYRDQLARGQHAFELNDHDRTLAILRDLEPDVNRLSVPEQAEYAYLRGVTDYRVGYKSDARHWLSIAKAYEDHSPGVLPADWKVRINEALDELNGVVYSAGTSALTTSRNDELGKGGPKYETDDTNTADDKGTKKEPTRDAKKRVNQDVPSETTKPSEPAANPRPARK